MQKTKHNRNHFNEIILTLKCRNEENENNDEREENYRLHTWHLEVVLDPHCAAHEAHEHFEGLLIVFVGDVSVVSFV